MANFLLLAYFSELKKDPGIPNLWPFKEELMDQIQQDRDRQEDEKRLAQLGVREQMAELRRRAEAAEGDFEDRHHSINEEAQYHGMFSIGSEPMLPQKGPVFGDRNFKKMHFFCELTLPIDEQIPQEGHSSVSLRRL
jgi:hypothetical protein